MKPADTSLAFVQACAVQPPRQPQATVAQWQQAALAEHASETGSTYRVLTRWQFGEVGQQADAWCADPAVRPHAEADARFAQELHASQADMAEAAVQGLMQSMQASRGQALADAAKQQCGVAVYATSGVDENFFQSSISRVVCGMGMSKVPHFGVAQWQGASWIGAMDIIGALSAESEGAYAAMLVCAEKWPSPFPRVLSAPAVLGDGAAALWIERVGDHPEQPALVCVDTALRSSAPYVASPNADMAPNAERTGTAEQVELAAQHRLPDVDRARILSDARELMGELLHRHGLAPTDVSGWLPCGLGRDWDQALQDSLGLDGLSQQGLAWWDEDTSGYLCAVSGPVFIERVLGAMAAGHVPDSARFLSWGVSLGGAVGVALLQARCPQTPKVSA